MSEFPRGTKHDLVPEWLNGLGCKPSVCRFDPCPGLQLGA